MYISQGTSNMNNTIDSKDAWIQTVIRFKDRLYDIIVHVQGKKEGNKFLDYLDINDFKPVSKQIHNTLLKLDDPNPLYSEEILLDHLTKYSFFVD